MSETKEEVNDKTKEVVDDEIETTIILKII